MFSPLVSTQWLNTNLTNDDLFVFDITISKVIGKEPIIYPQLVTIPTSYQVSIDNDLSGLDANAVHPFPSAEQVQQLAERLGFNLQSTLILYDDQGIYSAPRAWWILTSLGYKNVFIVDGGLPKWIAEGRPVDNTHQLPSPHLTDSAKPNTNAKVKSQLLHCSNSAVTTSDMLLLNIDSQKSLVIDVRAKARFLGLAAEPRAGVRSGHIPKSINLPFALVLMTNEYKSAGDLTALFEQLGCEHDTQIIFSCGSGITACIVLVAAIIAGFDKVSLYDGSWAEWGADKSLPIAT